MTEDKFVKKWSKKRKKNKFIFSLQWSIIIFICANMGNFIGRLITDKWYDNMRSFLVDLIIGIIFIPIFYLLCLFIYNMNEKRYINLVNK